MKTIYNVKKNRNNICLHQTLKGAKRCQKVRGGKIVKEQADNNLYKQIEK